MDLRGIANQVSDTVNLNIPVTVQSSTGFTTGAGLRQVPTYTPTSGFAQVQALDNSDLKQLDGLNIQGSIRAIYFKGVLAGVVRANTQGGDLVVISAGPAIPPALVGTWLIVKVLESWPNWSKAAITLQAAATV